MVRLEYRMSRKGSSKKRKHSVHWFRKGLRLSDNPALLRAIKRCETWRCIFILDPWFAGSSNVGTNKWRFLLQCLEDLDSSLRKLNSRLFVVRGQPADVLPTLFREWGTTYFTFEEDPEPFGRVRDQNIIAMCKEMGIVVAKEHSHTLYNLDRIIESNGGKAPLTYKKFQAIIQSMDPPPKPVPNLTLQILGNASSPIAADHDEKYGVPSLEELGFDCENLKPTVWVGGETEALLRLERHLERKAWVASFGRPKMTPQSLLASQTGVSPYLRFGCLSTRLFYHSLSRLYRELKKCEPPLSLHGQLLWREFFYCASTKNPNFDKMVGNPICVQIPWDKNDEALAKWANAHTGFPWIDAIMTQLREEGWIHHLARHAVACFLTRGDLWISWEEGMKVFDELLLDADWSVNAGTWLWLSCSSFFQQFFHCYCPVKFGRKADANGDFIRRYLPVLKNFPTRYIHEPWLAPEAVQKSAKCIIGVDYPKPMCNHAYVSKLNKERMNQVYQQLASHYSRHQAAGSSSGSSQHTSAASNQGGMFVPHDLLAELPKLPKMSQQHSNDRGNLDTTGDMGPPPDPPHDGKHLILHQHKVENNVNMPVGGGIVQMGGVNSNIHGHHHLQHSGNGIVTSTGTAVITTVGSIMSHRGGNSGYQQFNNTPVTVARQASSDKLEAQQQQFRYQSYQQQSNLSDRRLDDEDGLPLLSADMLLPLAEGPPAPPTSSAAFSGAPGPGGINSVYSFPTISLTSTNLSNVSSAAVLQFAASQQQQLAGDHQLTQQQQQQASISSYSSPQPNNNPQLTTPIFTSGGGVLVGGGGQHPQLARSGVANGGGLVGGRLGVLQGQRITQEMLNMTMASSSNMAPTLDTYPNNDQIGGMLVMGGRTPTSGFIINQGGVQPIVTSSLGLQQQRQRNLQLDIQQQRRGVDLDLQQRRNLDIDLQQTGQGRGGAPQGGVSQQAGQERGGVGGQANNSVQLNQNMVSSIPGFEAAIHEEFFNQSQK